MNRFIDYVNNSRYFSESEKKEEIQAFLDSKGEDRRVIIASMYGIFDSTIRGNIFTYYYWCSDYSTACWWSDNPKTRKRNWEKYRKTYRVDWNSKTDKIKIVRTRFNKRATENEYRTL